MIVRHSTLWAIAVLVLLASVSFSESVKLRKPRKRTTTRTPYQQQSRIGPVIIRVMHKYTDDGHARDALGGCINGNCRNAHDKFNLEAISEKNNFLSDEESLRYVVHPEKYEHFVMRKNAGHVNRYKRDAAFSELHSTNTNDHTMVDHGGVTYASNVSRSQNFTRVPLYRIRHKRDNAFSELHSTNTSDHTVISHDLIDPIDLPRRQNFTRVPLYRIRHKRDLSKSLRETGRTRRNLSADYSSRRNDSFNYYAQRKAVMDRYYARQREISAQYANRTNVIRLGRNDASQYRPATNNSVLFNLGHVYNPSKNSTTLDSTSFRHPSTRIDPIYSNESRYNRTWTELDSRRKIAPEIDLGFKTDADLSEKRSSDNIERNTLDYFVTPTPCTNLSSSGTFAPKTRSKHAKNCTEQSDCDRTMPDNDNIEGNQRWGRCEGKIVYQHNLLLGLTGPSNLDALFEVIIQGPVCITCVEALRYNKTRATVTLDSGGKGHEYAKLKLQGYENEGFSYIIKVWGVKKIGQICDNVN